VATNAVTAEGAVAEEQSVPKAYAPSWLDAVIARIEQARVPAWAVYLSLTAVALAINLLEAALSSRGLMGQEPAYFGYFLVTVLPLAAYHVLSRGAREAWDAFRPATDCGDAEAARWRIELSTTPARPALAVYVVSVVGYLVALAAIPAGFDLTGHQPAFVAVRVITEAFWMAPVSWMVVYLLFRQMRIVSQLHRSVARVNLLQPGPLHAMSRLTSRGAIVLLLLQLIPSVPLPAVTEDARLLVRLAVGPFLLLAVAAFFLPLRGMHELLEKDRTKRQASVATRIDSTVGELHRVVDDETDLAQPRDPDSSRLAQVRIDALNKALASLLQEREFIGKLSTWPWDTTTFRAVVSAVALPVLLFLVTRALEQFVL
jgi:hypothetical protein